MAGFLRGRDEGRKETAVLHKNPMTFDWPRSRKPIQVTLWMGNRGALTDVKKRPSIRVLDTDRLWIGTDGDSAGGDDGKTDPQSYPVDFSILRLGLNKDEHPSRCVYAGELESTIPAWHQLSTTLASIDARAR